MIAKIISLILSILQVFFSYVTFDNSLTVNESKKNYPFVFVHGFFGWNPEDGLDSKLSYWGCFAGDLLEYLDERGCECYESSCGCISSAWDRACEIYAQLTGTTVDYGKVHSQEYGHARYGKTYDKPLFEGWGKDKKINLISHSFGGNTARMFLHILSEGSKQEVEATKDGTLSEFFKGGKRDYVYSLTTFAAPLNGTTITDVMNTSRGSLLLSAVYELFARAANTSINDLYTTDLEAWNLFDIKDKKPVLNFERFNTLINSKDTGIYEMSLQGARDINEQLKCYDDIYYYSYSTCCTTKIEGTNIYYPNEHCVVTRPLTLLMGTYTGKAIGGEIDIDESWLPNDGNVNTISQLYPFDEKHKDFDKNNIEKGIWQVMPIIEGDHFVFMLGKENDTDGGKFLSKLLVDLVNTIISTY